MKSRRVLLSLRPNPDGPLPETAMVLAAGLGKRMRPLTATRPKPLVRVNGKTLIDHALDNLRGAGVRRAVVNVHYLAGQVEAHLARNAQDLDLTISDERDALLETGGGVAKALPLIGADPFFVVNSDNMWVDGPIDTLRQMARRWDPAIMDALLLVVPLARAHGYEGRGDFHMAPDGLLARRRGARVAPFVFSGVQILKASLFEDVPEGPFSLNLVYDRLIDSGRLYGIAHTGQWFHVGTPDAVKETEALLGDG